MHGCISMYTRGKNHSYIHKCMHTYNLVRDLASNLLCMVRLGHFRYCTDIGQSEHNIASRDAASPNDSYCKRAASQSDGSIGPRYHAAVA